MSRNQSINYTWDIVSQLVCYEFGRNFRSLLGNPKLVHDIGTFRENLFERMTQKKDIPEITQHEMIAQLIRELRVVENPEELDFVLNVCSFISEAHSELKPVLETLGSRLKSIPHSDQFHANLQLLIEDFVSTIRKILPTPHLLRAATSWGNMHAKWHNPELANRVMEKLRAELQEEDIMPILNLIEASDGILSKLSIGSDYYMFGEDIDFSDLPIVKQAAPTTSIYDAPTNEIGNGDAFHQISEEPQIAEVLIPVSPNATIPQSQPEIAAPRAEMEFFNDFFSEESDNMYFPDSPAEELNRENIDKSTTPILEIETNTVPNLPVESLEKANSPIRDDVSELSLPSSESNPHEVTIMENVNGKEPSVAQDNELDLSDDSDSQWCFSQSSLSSSSADEIPPCPKPKVIYLDELFGRAFRDEYAERINQFDTQELLSDIPGLPSPRRAENTVTHQRELRQTVEKNQQKKNTRDVDRYPKRQKSNDIRAFFPQGEQVEPTVERIPQTQASVDDFTQGRRRYPTRGEGDQHEDDDFEVPDLLRVDDRAEDGNPSRMPTSEIKGRRRPFVCQLCHPKRNFMTITNLNEHCRTVHRLNI